MWVDEERNKIKTKVWVECSEAKQKKRGWRTVEAGKTSATITRQENKEVKNGRAAQPGRPLGDR